MKAIWAVATSLVTILFALCLFKALVCSEVNLPAMLAYGVCAFVGATMLMTEDEEEEPLE